VSFTIAVDFDGTIVEATEPLRLRPEAAEALAVLKAAGNTLILWSARCTPTPSGTHDENEAAEFYREGKVPERQLAKWARFNEMRTFLKDAELWHLFDEVWQRPGKPHADFFLEDRTFDSSPVDWVAAAGMLGLGSSV
jgi:hypothetical protein